MGQAWPHRAASNYLYLFVRANSCILFFLFFKLSIWNRAETELKCNTGFRETVQNCHFSYTDSWYLVPFSSNTFGDRNHKASLYSGYTPIRTVKHISTLNAGGEGGVEAGYTARKFLTKQGVTNILPVTAMLDRVNGASY